MLSCKKALSKFPDCTKVIQLSRASKGDKKGTGLNVNQKRSIEQTTLEGSAISVPKDREKAAINAALLDMHVMCGVAFSVADPPWFRRFCHTLRPGFVPLSGLVVLNMQASAG